MLLLYFRPAQFEQEHEEIPDHDKVEPDEKSQGPPAVRNQGGERKGFCFSLDLQSPRAEHNLQLGKVSLGCDIVFPGFFYHL